MSNLKLNQAWVVEAGSSSAKAVLVYLADRADDTGKCWPELATIAAKCEMSERTVRRSIKSLMNRGLIEQKRRFNSSSIFAVLPRFGLEQPDNLTGQNDRSGQSDQSEPDNLTGQNDHSGQIDQFDRSNCPPNPKESSILSSTTTLQPDAAEVIESILRAWPRSNGREMARAILLGEWERREDLPMILERTRAIAAVIEAEYSPADRLRFVPGANRFFEERRWTEEPADWRQAKALAASAATEGQGDWGRQSRLNNQPDISDDHRND